MKQRLKELWGNGKMTDKEIEVIIKPIFTKMFHSNFSACEYGIECYKKGMEYQGIKELAIENDNLIKQVRKLAEQIEKMKRCEICKHYQLGSCNYHSNWVKDCKENGMKLFELKEIKENA